MGILLYIFRTPFPKNTSEVLLHNLLEMNIKISKSLGLRVSHIVVDGRILPNPVFFMRFTVRSKAFIIQILQQKK